MRFVSRSNLQMYLIIGAVILCVILALILRPINLSADTILLLSFPGELFFRCLKLMILPLVTTAIVTSSSSINIKENAALVIATLSYFLITSLISAGIGIVVASQINFGMSNETTPLEHKNSSSSSIIDNVLDLGRNLIPDNLVTSTFEISYTQQEDGERVTGTRQGTNMLGLVFFSMVFGSVMGAKKKEELITFFKSCFEVMMVILQGVMWTAPIGVGSIVLSKFLETEDLGETFRQLGVFVGVVAACLIFYQLVVMQLYYFGLTRKNPYKFYIKLFQPILTAFATASTLATLPTTFRAVDKMNMDKKVTRFVLPLGVTLNTDGSAMFVSIAALYICNTRGFELTGNELFIIGLLSTILAMAMGSVPSSSILCLIAVLNAVGVPTDGVKELFAVDFLLDRIRTTNNMLSDCYAAAAVEAFKPDKDKSTEQIMEMPENQTQIA